MSLYARVLSLWLLFAGAGAGGPVTAGTVAEVRPAFHAVTLTAFTRPRAVLRLVAEEAGRFASVDLDVGDRVEAGQSFGCLDTVYIDLDIEANQARRQRLHADLEYFSRQVARTRKLVQRNSSAQSTLDDLERQLAGTRASLREAEIAGRALEERRRRYCIAAPAGWWVTRRNVDPGQWIGAGEGVGEVADFSLLLAPFALSEAEYRALRAREGALRVRLPDAGVSVTATPVHLNRDFDAATRKLSLDLAIGEGVPERRGGLRVELRLDLPDPAGAVLVPAGAVQERYEQHWVTDGKGQAHAVVYLGEVTVEGERWARVVAPELAPGQRVRVP